MDIRKFVRPNIRSLVPYKAKEIPCRVKLDANESPYGFQESVDIIKSVQTNRYPDPEAKTLRKLAAKYYGTEPECILQGNGSDEIIYHLVTTFGGPVLYPVPTFSMFGIIPTAIGEKAIPVNLDREFDLDTDAMLRSIRKDKPRLIFLSTPNNPTGNCFSSERVLRIIEAARSKAIVVVDEAYQPFSSSRGFLPLLRDYKNMVIVRTLSKIGLAALRVGFLIADKDIINEVNKVRLPFNLNSFSQAIAVEVLKNRKNLAARIMSIASGRERLLAALSKTKGVTPFPSEANFILFRVDDPSRVYDGLLSRGVLVRNMKGVVEGSLRVTVGTPAENTAFLRALQAVLQQLS
jgi:histidinol-phosphate aminotransferase